MKMQVPAACFVGRSCRLSRKELLLIWEQKLRQQESSAVPSVGAGIAVQLQLWEPESGRKTCREGLRRGLPTIGLVAAAQLGCARPSCLCLRSDMHAVVLCHGKSSRLRMYLSEVGPCCFQSSLPARAEYAWGGRSWAFPRLSWLLGRVSALLLCTSCYPALTPLNDALATFSPFPFVLS